jgi:hypothetical protein
VPVAPKCRLFVIQARDAARAVVFRRGPSTHVMLALWHTDSDRVEEGQWLRGRIYERRADLSPDGTKLVYFAAQWRKPMQTWTAISTPPWLTAHVLWPKGDAWGGGGLWETNERVVLNHPYGDLRVDPSTPLPKKLSVREMGKFGGGGEDFPLWGIRLERDGWRVTSRGGASPPDFDRAPVWVYDPPIVYARSRPRDPSLAIEMRIHGVSERGGDWYVIDHRVVDAKGALVLDLGRSEWADWDARGDLVLARDGVLSRIRPRRGAISETDAKVVIDLRDRRFRAIAAPAHARTWRMR